MFGYLCEIKKKNKNRTGNGGRLKSHTRIDVAFLLNKQSQVIFEHYYLFIVKGQDQQ